MTRTHIPRKALVAAIAVAAAFIVGGCPSRQRIAEQTVAAKAQDAATEIESSQADAALVSWSEVRRIHLGFDEARAISVGPDGRLYAGGDEALRCFTPEGDAQWELPLEGEPRAVAVAGDGTIAVAFMERVELYDQAGRRLLSITPEDRRTWVKSIAIDGERILVGDAGARLVWRYDRQGTLLGKLGTKDPERDIPGIYTPSPHLDVALTGPDRALVVNPGRHSVQEHSLPDGALVGAWGDYSPDADGFSGCCNPTDIALLPDGRVVTSEKGTPRVKVHSAEGELDSIVASAAQFDEKAEGIDLAVDDAGHVLALDPIDGDVIVYEEAAETEEGGE